MPSQLLRIEHVFGDHVGDTGMQRSHVDLHGVTVAYFPAAATAVQIFLIYAFDVPRSFYPVVLSERPAGRAALIAPN